MHLLKPASKLLPLPLKIKLITLLKKKKLILNSEKRAFIFLSADYGNIGDIAISKAQYHFLNENLKGYEIVPIAISQTRFVIDSIKKQIQPNDIVTIVGGGNMGSMYPDIEELRQLVIRSFKNNRIVCFPQTLDWDTSLRSKKSLRHIVKVYSSHPDIYIFARESTTFSKLKDIFRKHKNVNIGLVPDIVMSATAKTLGAVDNSERPVILRCLRDDKEAALSKEQYDFIDAVLARTDYKIEKTDTHAGGAQLDNTYCTKLVADKINQFQSARLIITDRLHGMILALLSGTPCLVIPNANHKIKQTQLDWLSKHPRLTFVSLEQLGQLPDLINELLSKPHGSINETPVNSSQYDDLKKAIDRL